MDEYLSGSVVPSGPDLDIAEQVRALGHTVRELAGARSRDEVLATACREARRMFHTQLAIAASCGGLAVDGTGVYADAQVDAGELRAFHEDRLLRQWPSSASRFIDPLPESILAAPIPGDGRNVSLLLVATKERGNFGQSDEAVLAQIAELASVAIARVRSIEELEQENRGRERFMAVVAHELRTPLTVISGWSELLRSQHEGTIREIADSINESATVARKIVDELFEYSRASDGVLRLELEQVDVTAIAALTITDVRAGAERKSIKVIPPQQRGIVITADGSRLRQALWNVLKNAIRFTPEGGEIRVGVEQRSDEVILTVCDTGSGIDPSFLPHLFEPFRQQDRASGRGLGLGLAIVKQVVEAHGGSVSAESGGPGKGTTIRMTLPRTLKVGQAAKHS